MVLDNVPRIATPAPDVLWREWIEPGRPVVLRDLFDRAPLRAIDTLAAARQQLAALQLEIQPNYLTFFETGQRGARRSMALADYLDHVAREPTTRDLCVEFATPTQLRELLPPPACAALRAPDDVVSATFLANRGNYNHLHYDDDQRAVLLYQVFGSKRFSLISPEQGRKLDSFMVFDRNLRSALASIPARDANGRIYLHTFPDEAARESFLRYAGASDTVLGPGETLLMPALWWHYVEYLDTSLSVTHRLGRNHLNRALASAFPMPDFVLQEVGAKIADLPRFTRDQARLREELEAILRAISEGDAPRTLELRSFLERAFDTIFGVEAGVVRQTRELLRLSLAS